MYIASTPSLLRHCLHFAFQNFYAYVPNVTKRKIRDDQTKASLWKPRRHQQQQESPEAEGYDQNNRYVCNRQRYKYPTAKNKQSEPETVNYEYY